MINWEINKATVTLYRPVGPQELSLIKELEWKKFPPRLPEQPFFYPVLNKEYAQQITDQWNVPAYGAGFVLSFRVNLDYISKFNIENVGAEIHNELWIPSEELDEFNSNIQGNIDMIYATAL